MFEFEIACSNPDEMGNHFWPVTSFKTAKSQVLLIAMPKEYFEIFVAYYWFRCQLPGDDDPDTEKQRICISGNRKPINSTNYNNYSRQK